MIFNFIDDLERFEEMELELEEDQSTKRKVLKDHGQEIIDQTMSMNESLFKQKYRMKKSTFHELFTLVILF